MALEAVHAAAVEQHLGESESQYWAQKQGRAAVAQAWADGRRDPTVAAEIDRFEKAAMERLGSEGVAAALRHARGGASLAAPGVGAEQWQELGFNSSSVHTDIVSTTDRVVTAELRDGGELVIYRDGEFLLG